MKRSSFTVEFGPTDSSVSSTNRNAALPSLSAIIVSSATTGLPSSRARRLPIASAKAFLLTSVVLPIGDADQALTGKQTIRIGAIRSSRRWVTRQAIFVGLSGIIVAN